MTYTVNRTPGMCLFASALLFAGAVLAKGVVVRPGGQIANVPVARNAVRALRASGEKGDIDVTIQDGVYALDETLAFGVEDSAPEGALTRYRAEADHRVCSPHSTRTELVS